ncbi:ATP-binding domain-containing protein [Sphingomonas sp. CFBP9021]|uniref:ATP-binding domain-containing protein n=1 Tax=Sphingomonas sp. CFBP9021 TaxID=3096534 RepID=UPI002A6B2692|nr:ATP-binding domain-containing protein [Sphingomonas sp. CFBP9021]MDY0969063.1 ATP-binding domain-containing protein [Sphingomonas sp. CFBP9021]
MITSEQSEELGQAAEQTLNAFDTISHAARARLSTGPRTIGDALAVQNAFTSEKAYGILDGVERAEREASERLAREPAIARVVVEDGNGHREVIYVARAASPTGGALKVASYRSTLGRLASLEPDDFLDVLRDGKRATLTVVERAILRPEEDSSGWDAPNTVFETLEFGPVTVESLRRLIESAGGLDEAIDEIERMLREEEAAAEVIMGRQKAIIAKMGLRDQPALDKFQDEIFRLPLDSQLAVLGAPGSGKTTTLIKRLGLKLDLDIIADEAPLIDRATSLGADKHENSWLMFVPTNLLRAYVKDAFAEEGIAAPDSRIRSWSAHQRQLARTHLPILQGGMTGGTWPVRDEEPTLLNGTMDDSINWFEDFDGWQKARFWGELNTAAETLAESDDPRVQALATRLTRGLGESGSNARRILRLVDLGPELRSLLDELRASVAARIRVSLNQQTASDRLFIDRLATFMDTIGDSDDADEADDADADGDVERDDDDDADTQARTPRGRAIQAFSAALRAQARSYVAKRRLGRGRSASILRWIDENGDPQAGLSENDQVSVGRLIIAQGALRRLVSPAAGFVNGVSRRYRSFRRTRRVENQWYPSVGTARVVNAHEVDLMLLATLRSANELLLDPAIWRRIDEPTFAALKQISLLHRNQILVDEVTDFSPLQLGCMVSLANPRIRSIFLCGDFNQRITAWGLRDKEQLRWIEPALDIRDVVVAYRQSEQLYEFGQALSHATGGISTTAALPKSRNNDGFAPALVTNLADLDETALWLARRIAEIENGMKAGTGLPSTAVLVAAEELVEPVAAALDRALAEQSLRAVACVKGELMGQDGDVRVFDVQHIKGLEFEAVFFLGVDALAKRAPELFNRYLYVGTTRAATYLGVHCEEGLPASLQILESQFRPDWQNAA